MDFLRLSTTTFEDPKIKVLRSKYGRDGYLIYIHTLYLITQGLDAKHTSCELVFAADTLSFDLGMERAEIVKILETCIQLDLFEGDPESTIVCRKILKRLEKNKLSSGMRKIVDSIEDPIFPTEEEQREEYHSNFFNSENKEDLKTWSEQIYQIWESSGLPCKKGGFISFQQSDLMNGIRVMRRQGLKPSDVLAAVKNYAETINNPNSWYTAMVPFENFLKESTIKRFLPDYYKKENFLNTDKSSAVNNSGADTFKGEVNF
ncbi:MAG: DUF4373 domain-containing protein [Bacilli bacterium]|nr:DUF4373 domain-containing protein [Bacilli bacterium]